MIPPERARLFVLLVGPPGSGKGTQGARLSQRFGLPHISTGALFRAAISVGNPIGGYTLGELSAGRLATDQAVNGMLAERLAAPDASRGAILDGYPRTLQQVEFLTDWWCRTGRPVRCLVIRLLLDYNKVVARVSGRRECPVCHRTFDVSVNTPTTQVGESGSQDWTCDFDDAKLVVRPDDRPEAIRARWDLFEALTLPAVMSIRGDEERTGIWSSQVEEVSGEGQPEEVFQRICGCLTGLDLVSATR